MAKFKGTCERRFTIQAPKEKVAGFMTQPAEFKVCFEELETHEEVSPGVWRWVLKEKNEKGVRFKPDYTVKYVYDEGKGELIWTTQGKCNLTTNGRATFRSLGPNTTEVDYTDTMECEMEVNALLGKIIAPIVNREIGKGVGSYLDLCKKHLERG